ncbi:MAG: FmdB family zinc ribbon protein [Nitrospirota bacterium]
MPIYEYECLKCGKQYEVFQKFSDEPLSSCADCGGPVHKLVSHTSFVLKGTGWYVTDYASSERKKAKEAESKPDTKSEAKAETTPKT